MVELSNKMFTSDIIWENSPGNSKNKSFYGAYPFKLWTLASVLKYKFKVDEISRSDFFMIANNWIPRTKQPKPIDISCG